MPKLKQNLNHYRIMLLAFQSQKLVPPIGRQTHLPKSKQSFNPYRIGKSPGSLSFNFKGIGRHEKVLHDSTIFDFILYYSTKFDYIRQNSTCGTTLLADKPRPYKSFDKIRHWFFEAKRGNKTIFLQEIADKPIYNNSFNILKLKISSPQ